MMKIYAADRYNGRYSRCSVIVADKYIYSADRFTRNLMGSPDTTKAIARIDYEKGVIREHGTLFSKIIAEFERKNGEIRVYRVPRSLSDTPVFTVENNKMYTGVGGFFSQLCGYIEYSENTADAQGQAADFGELYYAFFGRQGGGKEDEEGEVGCLQMIVGAVGGVALLAALIRLIIAAVVEGTKSAASSTFFLLTHVPIVLVAVVMMAVLTVNLKKTFNQIDASANVKRQCRRAALPVALKAMIIPLVAALLGMVLSNETAMLLMSVPFLILLFGYCWLVVNRMMQAGLLDRKGNPRGKTNGKNMWSPCRWHGKRFCRNANVS